AAAESGRDRHLPLFDWQTALFFRVVGGRFWHRGRLPKWPTGADCKSAGLRLRWFESITYHHFFRPSSPAFRFSATAVGKTRQTGEGSKPMVIFEKWAKLLHSLKGNLVQSRNKSQRGLGG